MADPGAFKIDVKEEFPHLSNAPIVEAVLHWRAAAGRTLDQARIQDELGRRFANYDCREQQHVGAAIQTSQDGVEFRQQTRWDGFRLTGRGLADRFVVQFKPNGIVFSRLAKYPCWKSFQDEGLRFWEAYLELAGPPVIERLGVRFINQIQLGAADGPAVVLREPPNVPTGIGLLGGLFFYQDTLRVAGYPYQVNWIRTVQPNAANDRMLIVDIDVSTEPNELLERPQLLNRLAEMRFLKNKLFFTCITDQALRQFGEHHGD